MRRRLEADFELFSAPGSGSGGHAPARAAAGAGRTLRRMSSIEATGGCPWLAPLPCVPSTSTQASHTDLPHITPTPHHSLPPPSTARAPLPFGSLRLPAQQPLPFAGFRRVGGRLQRSLPVHAAGGGGLEGPGQAHAAGASQRGLGGGGHAGGAGGLGEGSRHRSRAAGKHPARRCPPPPPPSPPSKQRYWGDRPDQRKDLPDLSDRILIFWRGWEPVRACVLTQGAAACREGSREGMSLEQTAAMPG